MQLKKARAWGCSQPARAAATGLALCFRIRPLPKSRRALNVSALPVFRRSISSVTQLDLEYWLLLVGSLSLAAGAPFVLVVAI
jgi:hypothetical protein